MAKLLRERASHPGFESDRDSMIAMAEVFQDLVAQAEAEAHTVANAKPKLRLLSRLMRSV